MIDFKTFEVELKVQSEQFCLVLVCELTYRAMQDQIWFQLVFGPPVLIFISIKKSGAEKWIRKVKAPFETALRACLQL